MEKEKLNKQLLLAARQGNKELCEILIEFGADINTRDEGGRCVFHLSHEKCLEYFVEHDVCVDTRDKNGRSAFLDCISHIRQDNTNDYFLKASKLLKLGANINLTDNNGWGALHWFAYNDLNVDWLIANGANLNAKTNDRKTPLDIATERKNWRVKERIEEWLKSEYSYKK